MRLIACIACIKFESGTVGDYEVLLSVYEKYLLRYSLNSLANVRGRVTHASLSTSLHNRVAYFSYRETRNRKSHRVASYNVHDLFSAANFAHCHASLANT
jgi:hypothetical protein